MVGKSSPPSPLTLDELIDIISAHRQWERSGGQEGEKAVLSGANLEGLDLDGYDLSNLDFREAKLARVKFGDSLVEGANFQASELGEADLSDVRGLLAPQLAGADLAGAILPEGVEKFESLPHVNAAIKHAQTTFFSLLLVCVFCWLGMAITTDAGLLTNTIETPLPVINTKVNIAAFYIAAPLLLFCLYVYLSLYHLRLWETLSELPAIFPDGRPLPHHLHPWLGSGLLWTFFPRLRRRSPRPNLIWGTNLLFKFLSCWLAPLTLLALWWRSLPAHNWLLNGPQIALLSPTLAAGLILPMYARSTLRLQASRFEMRRFVWGASVIVLTGAVAVIFSYYAFTGWFAKQYQVAESEQLNRIILGISKTFSDSTCANLEEVEVSTKPLNWSGKPEEVKGANLRGRSLPSARAREAFLVNADLRNTQLVNAGLLGADLRKAKLCGADLRRADLTSAKLKEADLSDANLRETNLFMADLDKATIGGANLKGAKYLYEDVILRTCNWPLAFFDQDHIKFLGLPPNHDRRLKDKDFHEYPLSNVNFLRANMQKFNLKGAVLQGAILDGDFSGANLQGADLRGAGLRAIFNDTVFEQANLQGAKYEGGSIFGDQVRQACNWPLAFYSDEVIQDLNLPLEKDHNRHLRNKDLRGYHLQGANLQGADLRGFDLQGADLREAHLEGANLLKVKNLTQKQLDSAITDGQTILPNYLILKTSKKIDKDLH